MAQHTAADEFDAVSQDDVRLEEGAPGFSIMIGGEYVGGIEGTAGHLEYITVEMHWEGKGVARAAIREFIDESRRRGAARIVTTAVTHPATRHVVETEGFEERDGEVGWVKEL